MSYPIEILKERLIEVEQAIEFLKSNGNETMELEEITRTKYVPLIEAIHKLQNSE